MKEIPLTRGMVAIVDDDDFERINKHKWYACKKGKQSIRWYARRNSRAVYMHNEIMTPPHGMEIDHINGNTLDNRKSNLRPVTRYQNSLNTAVRSDSVTGVKGVGWHSRRQQYRARITVNGNKMNLGWFNSLVDAITARKDAEQKHHGDFRRKN